MQQKLPDFVPVLVVPEGNVHCVPPEAFNDATVTVGRAPDKGYVFRPNRNHAHLSGRESKVRCVRYFGSEKRKGKLYFLRTRTVERRADASAEFKIMTQLLDQIKSQNNAFKTLELDQMRKVVIAA
jgi:hypothetical protein